MTKAKSKKVANITFPILLLAAFDSFSSPLARSSSPVKVLSKRHTWVSLSIVFTTSKSPKIFNNRPVNKLVFSVLTTTTISTTATASQMATKAKNSKKQQQVVTTAMVTLNPFVVSDEILKKIYTAAVSLLSNMNAVLSDVVLSSRSLPVIVAKQSITSDNLKDWADQMEIESTAPPPVSGTANSGAWENVNGCQRFSGWMASNLVPGSTFKIKMVLLNAVKLFCVEFAFQESLNGAIKVAIGNKVFLTTLKIAQFSGVASVSSSLLFVALRNVLLGTFLNDIKSALGIFGVLACGNMLWFTAEAFKHWSVLVKKDSVRIFPVVNQRKFSRLVAKPVSFPDLLIHTNVNILLWCQDLDYLAVNCKVLPPLSSKSVLNSTGGPKVFKFLFTGAKSYAKVVVFVVFLAAATVDIDLVLDLPSKVVVPMISGIYSVPIAVVEFRLASMESYLNELALLVKSIIELVNFLVVLVTKLLSTPPAVNIILRESMVSLERQIKAVAAVAFMLN
ncbi:hypothetical protein G9A89_019802 [Geosiphon pyriformis]|nr:hypothetical protein G9A89_019802 [Geosiphon pyriformis]